MRVRAVTEPMEEWGLGGGVVSTAAPAAAAVRLLARGEISEPAASLPPERCVDPEAMFARARAARLSGSRSQAREEVRA